jgi:hypothetical protein
MGSEEFDREVFTEAWLLDDRGEVITARNICSTYDRDDEPGVSAALDRLVAADELRRNTDATTGELVYRLFADT